MLAISRWICQPLEVGCLAIYDPATAPGDTVRFKEILAAFQDCLDRCDVFRQRLVEVPFSLDHPYWVEDRDFDIEYHVRHIALPRPGDWRQLMIQISRLQSQHLDHSRPLWEAYVIEGLDNVSGVPKGSFALFMKMHHATIDGASGKEVQKAIHDLEPVKIDLAEYESPPPRDLPDPPAPWGLLARSPVADADMSRVREMQRETGQSLRQILVGGGYVTMENWFRAQKDAVLNEMFNVLLLKRPYVEVKIGQAASTQAGDRLDLEVPLLPWLRSEVIAMSARRSHSACHSGSFANISSAGCRTYAVPEYHRYVL